MCGIAVSASLNGAPANRLLVPTMLSQMPGRGDCLSETSETSLGTLGCNRLAIVDVAHGMQPMLNEQGDIAIVFNGEIYNTAELTDTLSRAGHRFASECDTEILVHAYEQWGEAMLSELRGMFAFVVLDQSQRRVFAGRDPFGIKPLFYSRRGDQFLFASEIKALVKAGAATIQVVPPGGYVDNGVESSRLHFPRPLEIELPQEDAKAKLRGLLRQSVRSMLQTDLPVAILCSGGIDSSAVLYEAAQTSANITAYSIGTSLDAPDVAAARKLTRLLRVPFRPILVSETSLLESIPQVVASIESFEPNHIRGGTLSFALARAIHEDGIKVALCGEGADELLAGYPEFQDCFNSPDPGATLRRDVEQFTSELHRTQLQRVDRTNMAWSVEVRVPFLDLEFATFALSLASELKLRRSGDGTPIAKWILREAYREVLPAEIADRPKLILSEGAGVGDNGPHGPFFEHANRLLADDEFTKMCQENPEFQLRTKEEAFYFRLFRNLYGPLPLAANRPRVNVQPTIG